MFNTFLNWSIAAILASITMMPVSVNRQTAPTAEPLTEEAQLKGCNAFLKNDQVRFKYIGPNFDKHNVEDESLWEQDEEETRSCNAQDVYACVIYVDESYVGSSGDLDPSIDLQAASSLLTPTIFHIVGADDPTMTPFNNSTDPLE